MKVLRPRDPHRVPFLLRGWIENVPELREAWNDPLAEWWREHQMRQGGIRKGLWVPIWISLVGGWTVFYYVLLPAMMSRIFGIVMLPTFLTYGIVMLGLASPQLLFVLQRVTQGKRRAMVMGYATPIQETLYGDREQRERWWEVPLTGDRVARLVMLSHAQRTDRKAMAMMTLALALAVIPLYFKLWVGAVLILWTALCLGVAFVAFSPTPGLVAAAVLKQHLVFAARQVVPLGSPIEHVSKEEDGVLADQVPVLLGVVVLTGVLWLSGVLLALLLFLKGVGLPAALWFVLPPVMVLCAVGLDRLRKASLNHVRIRLGGACARLAAAWDHFRASTDDENWRALTDKPYGFPA